MKELLTEPIFPFASLNCTVIGYRQRRQVSYVSVGCENESFIATRIR